MSDERPIFIVFRLVNLICKPRTNRPKGITTSSTKLIKQAKILYYEIFSTHYFSYYYKLN